MVKWLHFAGGYGHLRYWPPQWRSCPQATPSSFTHQLARSSAASNSKSCHSPRTVGSLVFPDSNFRNLRKRLKRASDEEGIEIPFPHRVMVTRGGKATDR